MWRRAGSQSQQGQHVEYHGAYPNMNPALNENMAVPQGSVQVMNVLDVPANNNTALEQLMTVDAGYLQGLPVSMLDWGASSIVLSVAVEIDDECVRA